MAYNLERCFHRAMMKHFPGEDGDTDDEFWIREDVKREKRCRRTIRSSTGNVWTRSRDSEGSGRKQPHVQNGGKHPPHKAKHRVPISSSSSVSSSAEDSSSQSVQLSGKMASSNGRGFLHSHHYGGMPSCVSHSGHIVSISLTREEDTPLHKGNNIWYPILISVFPFACYIVLFYRSLPVFPLLISGLSVCGLDVSCAGHIHTRKGENVVIRHMTMPWQYEFNTSKEISWISLYPLSKKYILGL